MLNGDSARTEILFYVACLERYLALSVKAEQKQHALEIMPQAYNTWCEYPDNVGDACCEEYVCKCLTDNGI